MSNSEAFLNVYRDLEEVLERKYGQRAGVVQLFSKGEGAKYYEELNLFRETRNLLSHHGQIDGQACIVPSDSAVTKICEILEFAKNPPVAMTIATPKNSLSCADDGDNVVSILDIIEKTGFSHIPILNGDGTLKGVFSVSTLFSYVRSNPEGRVKGLKIGDLSEFTPVHRHATEKFSFTTRDASAFELKKLFNHKGPYKRRIVAVFVTTDGTEKGKLLGMITPWDILKAE